MVARFLIDRRSAFAGEVMDALWPVLGWRRTAWMLRANADLNGRSPVQAIREGSFLEVRGAAERCMRKADG